MYLHLNHGFKDEEKEENKYVAILVNFSAKVAKYETNVLSHLFSYGIFLQSIGLSTFVKGSKNMFFIKHKKVAPTRT